MNKCNVTFSNNDENVLSLLGKLSNKDNLIWYKKDIEDDYERIWNLINDEIINPTSLSNSYSNLDSIIKDVYYLMLDWNAKQKASGMNRKALTTQEMVSRYKFQDFYNYIYERLILIMLYD